MQRSFSRQKTKIGKVGESKQCERCWAQRKEATKNVGRGGGGLEVREGNRTLHYGRAEIKEMKVQEFLELGRKLAA